jgi:outer membrane protein
MKKMITIASSALLLAVAAPAFAADKAGKIGIVDFGRCVTTSKFGRVEQENFENVRKEMQKTIEDLDGQLTQTAHKLQDKELLDSLSPEAEKELKVKFQALGEELNRYQGNYYQILQQANMKLVHTLSEWVAEASDTVSKKDKYTLIVNKEAVFYFDNALDITESVVQEMDKKFDKAGKTIAQSQPAK